MKRIVLILAALLALLLTGCCQHEWAPAGCEAPEICASCQETRGKALGHDWAAAACEAAETCTRCGAAQGDARGHDWAPATCEAPEVCARCAATQGDALGHQFGGAWTVLENGEEMTQSCTTCGITETATLDWCTYLTGMLQGRWVEESCFLGLTMNASQDYYYNYAPLASNGSDVAWTTPNCLEFSPDGRVRILTDESIREGSYAIETREMESGTVYDVAITADDGTAYVMSFANYFYRDADGSEQQWEPEGYDHNWYMYDPSPEDNSFRYSVMADFFPDINGFYPDSVYADRLGMLVVGTGMFVYTKQDMSAPIAQAFTLPIGTWEPGEQENDENNTVTFSEVGTFTMTGDTNVSGHYRVSNYRWNPAEGGYYEYALQLDDTDVYSRGDIYLGFDGGLDGYPQGVPYMRIHLNPWDGVTQEFEQYLFPAGEAPQEPNIMDCSEETYQPLAGHWQLTGEDIYLDGGTYLSTEETTLDIHPDGSFTLNLAEPVSGTWDTIPADYFFFSSAPSSTSHYRITLPADAPYHYPDLSLSQVAGKNDKICFSIASADYNTHWLYFSKAE